MKKLMIAAAVAVSAVALNAATVNWTSGFVKSPSIDALAAGLTQGESYSAAVSGTTGSKILSNSDYRKYGDGIVSYVLTLTYDLGDGEVTHTYRGEGDNALSKERGTMSSTGKIQTTVTDALFDAANKGKSYTYAYTLVTTGKDGAGNAYEITATVGPTAATVQENSDIQLEVSAPTAWIATTVTPPGPGPVPEPTSGLLLLLGVAGLALRRRRA